jgi:hypothetical protein
MRSRAHPQAHAETRTHVTALERVCEAMKLDVAKETPGRAVVRHNGAAMVEAMKMALSTGTPAAAELVACECVVLAETKDHAEQVRAANDGRRSRRSQKRLRGRRKSGERAPLPCQGWCRELWLESSGLKSVLPPPEERHHVKTAIGAARAEKRRRGIGRHSLAGSADWVRAEVARTDLRFRAP